MSLSRQVTCGLCRAALLLVLATGEPALAADTWSDPAPGIRLLHRTTGTQDYHVVLVDLARPEIWLRATKEGENGQRTSAWATSVGAKLAINGDLWDANNWSAYQPLGLAVGDGWKWRDDTDVWSFFACDVTKRCWLNPWGNLEEWNPRWHNAVGGMQDLLVIDGVAQSYSPAYYQERHPRTAIGLSQDGATLILLVVDGRRSGAAGMSFAELTAVMLEFGAHNAMNNDGGGSSTLVIDGAVRNTPSDGSERVVANHLGIMISGHTDAACQGTENARVCIDATRMRTCTGGLDRGVGDCAAFGLSCEQQGLFAYCVDPRCSNGGQRAVCAGETRIGFCTDGVYSEGDCAGFGLPCVEGFDDAWCWADFYQAEPVTSSLGGAFGGELDVVAGVAAEVWFELRNSGRVAWSPSSTRLAPLPRDAASPLAGPDWPAPHRATGVDQATAVGAIGRFTFTVVAPAPGDYVLELGLVQEGVTWLADRPGGGGPEDGALSVILHAVAPPPDAGTAHDSSVATEPDAGSARDRGDGSKPDAAPAVDGAARDPDAATPSGRDAGADGGLAQGQGEQAAAGTALELGDRSGWACAAGGGRTPLAALLLLVLVAAGLRRRRAAQRR